MDFNPYRGICPAFSPALPQRSVFLMHILPLDRKKYDYFELHYSYTTPGHYKAVVSDSKEQMSYTLTRENYDAPRTEENTDTLFQDYWENPEAFAACDDNGTVLGYVEFAPEEWNNRLRMTQLLVLPESRGKGVGRFLVNFVVAAAKERDYRVVVLETQNYNLPAIDFYHACGFRFCGGNTFFYSNSDIEDDEVMLEMSFLVD